MTALIVAYVIVGAVATLIAATSEGRHVSPRRTLMTTLSRHPFKVLVLWALWPLMLVAKFMEGL